MDKKFSFSKDIATTIGLECAVIYEFLKNKKTDYISISELNDELNFWPNQKIIEYVAELDQKGLISFDLKRGRLSIKNKISKTKLQTPHRLPWRYCFVGAVIIFLTAAPMAASCAGTAVKSPGWCVKQHIGVSRGGTRVVEGG